MRDNVNRQWCLARRPVGRVKESDFEWREVPLPAPGRGQALVRNQLLSIDAVDRCWMREEETYLPIQRVGEVVRSIAIGQVIQSNLPDLPSGSNVLGLFGWQEYALTDGIGEFFMRLSEGNEIPAAMRLGLLGPAGIAAYFGIKETAKAESGDVLVVSDAGGAIGSIAGQIGKLSGCRVIGIAGSTEECSWLTSELGFDGAINYKHEPVYKRLREYCDNGIDIYFDSVGGSVLEDVLGLLKLGARVVLCDMQSAYNDLAGALALPPGPNNLLNLIFKRARMEGFVCLDYWPRCNEALEALADWHRRNLVKFHIEVVEGLREAPRALNRVFDGANKGKLMLQL